MTGFLLDSMYSFIKLTEKVMEQMKSTLKTHRKKIEMNLTTWDVARKKAFILHRQSMIYLK